MVVAKRKSKQLKGFRSPLPGIKPVHRSAITGGTKPEPNKKTRNGFDILKPQQVRADVAFTPCLAAKPKVRHALFQGATASGKSYIARAFANRAFIRGFRVMYTTPTLSTNESFQGPKRIAYSAKKEDEFYSPASPSLDSEKVDAVIAFLTRAPTVECDDFEMRFAGRSCVCTHSAYVAALTKIAKNPTLRKRFRRHAETLVIVVDEVHHISASQADANGMGKAVTYAIEAGARILGLTATLFRGDSKSIFDEEITADMVKETYLFYEYFQSLSNFTTVGVSLLISDLKKTLVSIFRRVKKEKHKAIIWLPPQNSNWARRFSQVIGGPRKGEHQKKAFFEFLRMCAAEAGLDVRAQNFVDCASEAGQSKNRTFLEGDNRNVVGRFQAVKHLDSDFSPLPDVIVAQDLYKEGTDVPPWSMAIDLGMCLSAVKVIQKFGRVVRDHISKKGKECEYIVVLPPFDASVEEETVSDYAMDSLFTFLYVLFSLSIECKVKLPKAPKAANDNAPAVDECGLLTGSDEDFTRIEEGDLQRSIKKVLTEVLATQERPAKYADELLSDPRNKALLRTLSGVMGIRSKIEGARSNSEICKIIAQSLGQTVARIDKTAAKTCHEWANEKVGVDLVSEDEFRRLIQSTTRSERAVRQYMDKRREQLRKQGRI